MAVGAREARATGGDSVESHAAARRLLVLQLAAIAVWLAGVALVVSQFASGGERYDYWLETTASPIVILPVAILLGRRRPDHPVSWLFTVIVCCGSIQLLSGAVLESASRIPVVMGGVLGYLHDTAQVTFVTALVSLILLYPTGRLLSRRWRFVGYSIAASLVLTIVGLAVRTAPLYGGHQSPLAIAGAVAQAADDIAGALLVLGLVGAILSAVLRFRRSAGVERQQMKWFVFTVVVGVLVLVFGDTLTADGDYGAVLWAVVPSSVLASVGVAIVQHGLYDIDRVVSRTVAYAAVTALLVGVYAVTSLLLAPAVAAVGGGSNGAVAVATLAVAAAFGPLRRRVQGVVDRVFDRRRYDAVLTAESFRSRLRDEVEIEQLQGALMAAVRETVAPARVTVWVRGDT